MTAKKLHIDFETRSTQDLKVVGLDNYAKHPGTDVWCMGWAFDDESVEIWTPTGQPLPERIREHVKLCEPEFVTIAHNAAFELAIWNNIMVPRYGWPMLFTVQCRCTMAMAYAMALPGSLEKAAAAVGIKEQKDLAGGRLMMQMAKPRHILCESIQDGNHYEWWDEPAKLDALYEYCKQDVRVERELEKRLMPLSADEQNLWVLDQWINLRGVGIDQASVAKAIKIVAAEKQRLDEEMRRVTEGVVSVCSEVKRLGDWLRGQGVAIDGVAKADVLEALSLAGLPDVARSALLLRQEAGKTSTAKLRAMVDAASLDGRVRNTMQYHGAAPGRWSGRRIQPHNLPRPTAKFADIEDAIENFGDVDYLSVFHGPPLSVVSNSLRSMIVAAPGKDLLAADFANIEGRGLAWLAGEEWKLQAFRDFDAGIGPDLYLVAASRIYECEPSAFNKDSIERQHGKVAELACGYGGGVGAFQMMAKTYLVKVDDVIADRIKTKWREAHPNIVRYWYDLDDAMISAVLNAGRVFTVRGCKFKVSGSFLWLQVPSGRVICYPYPTVKPTETPWGEMKDQVHYMTVDGLTNKWVETHTYGGKTAQNITEAVCRDVLVHAIRAAEAASYPVVLHVHDEVVSEVDQGFGSLEEFEALCSQTPAWAKGLPVVAHGWRGERYRKG